MNDEENKTRSSIKRAILNWVAILTAGFGIVAVCMELSKYLPLVAEKYGQAPTVVTVIAAIVGIMVTIILIRSDS